MHFLLPICDFAPLTAKMQFRHASSHFDAQNVQTQFCLYLHILPVNALLKHSVFNFDAPELGKHGLCSKSRNTTVADAWIRLNVNPEAYIASSAFQLSSCEYISSEPVSSKTPYIMSTEKKPYISSGTVFTSLPPNKTPAKNQPGRSRTSATVSTVPGRKTYLI